MEITTKHRLVLTTAALILTLLGVMQLTKALHFNLPVPLIFPALAIILPSITLFLLFLPIASARVFESRRAVYPVLLTGLLVISSILLGFMAPFHNHALIKSGRIERIQSSLQCCGFNSVYDRAYPFPSSENTANACVLAFKYSQSCAQKWMHESNVVTVWCTVVFVSVFGGALVGLLHAILAYKRRGSDLRPSRLYSSQNATSFLNYGGNVPDY
ncbi:hypothetical protein V1514DRAFT_357351 [Lipomyces japonicus]|uniref:uncharacterized protein n=1 Tax=Lipomyces japonicus TaxID=56871 RepID=UPI0034CF8D64